MPADDAKLTTRIPAKLKADVDKHLEKVIESGQRRRYSLNEFILDAIEEKLERDRRKK